MHITQSTSVGGLNPDWFIDCEACEMAGSAWSVEETRVLLNLWGDDRVQRPLEGAVPNKAVFETIQRALVNLGYQRTWIQCRVKVKNLIATYRKIKDNNNRSGQGRSDFLFLICLTGFWVLDQLLDPPTSCQAVLHPQQPHNLTLTHQLKTQSLHKRKMGGTRLQRTMRLRRMKTGRTRGAHHMGRMRTKATMVVRHRRKKLPMTVEYHLQVQQR